MKPYESLLQFDGRSYHRIHRTASALGEGYARPTGDSVSGSNTFSLKRVTTRPLLRSSGIHIRFDDAMKQPKSKQAKIDLVKPAQVYLASYVDALKRGWSPDGTPESAAERLRRIDGDPQGFLRSSGSRMGAARA